MKTILNTLVLSVLMLCVILPVQAEKQHYSIDAQKSYIRLLVYKKGALQFFGHNHVISHSKIQGDVVRNTSNIDRSRFIINLAVNQFTVDDKAERQKSGDAFSLDIDSEDAQATKNNMLRAEVLDSENYPDIIIRGAIGRDAGQYIAHADINIKGVARKYSLPIDLVFSDDSMTCKGSFSVKQSDFGIQPFSLLGGMLAVQDSLDVVFSISMTRL